MQKKDMQAQILPHISIIYIMYKWASFEELQAGKMSNMPVSKLL